MWNDPSRFKVAVCGRRFGKTFWLAETLLHASDKRDSLNIYIAPTRSQAKDIMWQKIKERVDELGWDAKTNESELSIARANGSIIQLKSAEKPGRLRGLGIDLVAMDEYAEYRSKEIWTQVVRPALSDKQGKAIFAMTPKGFNHGYDIFNEAKTQPNWAAFSYRTIDSPIFQTPEGKAEIEEARRNLTERDFKQEYEASFENFAGRIYYAFDRKTCHSDATFNKDLPYIVGQDFNRSPMSSTIHQKFGSEFVQVDEIFLTVSDTPEVCRVIKERFGPNGIFRPDSTGAKHTSNSSFSDHEIIRSHGFGIQARPSNPARVDRWAAVNRAFEKGLSKINVNKCPRTVKDLEVICYKEGACEPMLTDPMLGHLGDAHGYAIYIEFPINGGFSVGRYA